jgi:hypothetical protein
MAKSPPHGLSWRSNTLFIVATVGIGLFTDLFLYGLVVPILPSILRDKVGESPEHIQKDVSALLTVYAAASVITSPFAGILADRLSSRQVPFLAGLVALLSATVLLFVGTTLPVLAIARILQGVSAAFVWTIGLALCLETVGAENLGKTIGSVSAFEHVVNCVITVTNKTNVDLLVRLRGQPLRSASRRHSLRKDRLRRRLRRRFRPDSRRLRHASLGDREESRGTVSTSRGVRLGLNSRISIRIGRRNRASSRSAERLQRQR